MNRVKKFIEKKPFPIWHVGHWDKYGKLIPLMEWARLLEDLNYRRVGLDTVKYGFRVSTVWLGLDHGFGGRILIFETMVFPPHDMTSIYCKRYSTLKEASRCHAKIVVLLKDMKRINWTAIRAMLDDEI